MPVFLKIINALLILFAVFMGIKQGWAMVSGKPEMVEMFSKWNSGKTGMLALGAFTMLGAILVLFPQTFLWGNFITATGILFMMALHLQHHDLKGFAIEVPFFLMSLLILYWQHPLVKTPAS